MLSLMRRYKLMHPEVTTLLYRAHIARVADEGKVQTHAGYGIEPDDSITCGTDLIRNLYERFSSVEKFPLKLVIGLEEAQFVQDFETAMDWLNDHATSRLAQQSRILFYFTALDGTFQQQPWPEISAVLPKCRTFHKSTLAVCMCCKRQPAPYSRRDTLETALVVTGAKEKYSASCMPCLKHAGQPPCYFSRLGLVPPRDD
jgi:thymidine kinase